MKSKPAFLGCTYTVMECFLSFLSSFCHCWTPSAPAPPCAAERKMVLKNSISKNPEQWLVLWVGAWGALGKTQLQGKGFVAWLLLPSLVLLRYANIPQKRKWENQLEFISQCWERKIFTSVFSKSWDPCLVLTYINWLYYHRENEYKDIFCGKKVILYHLQHFRIDGTVSTSGLMELWAWCCFSELGSCWHFLLAKDFSASSSSSSWFKCLPAAEIILSI